MESSAATPDDADASIESSDHHPAKATAGSSSSRLTLTFHRFLEELKRLTKDLQNNLPPALSRTMLSKASLSKALFSLRSAFLQQWRTLWHLLPLLPSHAVLFCRTLGPPSPRALLALFLVFLFLFWVANDCPPDCSMLPPIRPANPCGYSDKELSRILQEPRGFAPGHARYYLSGRWMTFVTVKFELQMWRKPLIERKQAPEELPPCVLVSVQGQLPCLGAPCLLALYLRPLTSDISALKAHLEDVPSPLQSLAEDVSSGRRFDAILDAGANIGVASALLALMFPASRIVAVEASADNHRMLQLNTREYPNVVPLHAALWDRPGPTLVVHRNPRSSGFWGLQVSEWAPPGRRRIGREGEGEVSPFGTAPAVDLPLLLALFGLPAFPLVRLDIEGAESRALSNRSSASLHGRAPKPGACVDHGGDWARGVQVALVATHESFTSGAESAAREAFPLDLFSMELTEQCTVFRRRRNCSEGDSLSSL